jgi:hypothetical protein
VVLRPLLDIAASPTRAAHATVVVGGHVEARTGQLVTDLLVAPRVLGEAVDEQDERPGFAGPRPTGFCLVGRPVPDEQVGAVGGRDVMDDRRHDRRVRDRSATHPAGSLASADADAGGSIGGQAGSPTGPPASTRGSAGCVTVARAPAPAGMNSAARAPIPTTTAPTAMAGWSPAT